MLPRRACYGVTAKGIVFDGVADALRVPDTDIRLFGKPESNARRRMGVALAFDAEVARVNAKRAAGMVKPRGAGCRLFVQGAGHEVWRLQKWANDRFEPGAVGRE